MKDAPGRPRDAAIDPVVLDTTIRLLPPLICNEAQIDDIVARVAHLLSSIPTLNPAEPTLNDLVDRTPHHV